MSRFKVGDKVRILNKTVGDSISEMENSSLHPHRLGDIVFIGDIQSDGVIVAGNGWCFNESDLEPINNNNNNNNNMNLIQQFKLTLKSEPEKTLIKTGIMNDDETLTSEGKDLFFEWLFQNNKEKFTEEVANKILEEQEKENK